MTQPRPTLHQALQGHYRDQAAAKAAKDAADNAAAAEASWQPWEQLYDTISRSGDPLKRLQMLTPDQRERLDLVAYGRDEGDDAA